ncbi:MAG TPA: hypothetical protein VMW25_03245 [Clostridia bacterium]|nr:hypothetical protein [Clostridia bacterium]
MAPHLERWNHEARQMEEVPGTRHRTDDKDSPGYQRTMEAMTELFESGRIGDMLHETSDELGNCCVGEGELPPHLEQIRSIKIIEYKR